VAGGVFISHRLPLAATMQKVTIFIHIVDNVNMWIAKLTAFLVIPLGAILLYGVIMRYVFNNPILWEMDISWLLFVGFSVLAGAYALRQDYHVRLDVLYGRLSPKRKAIMNVATFIFFLVFIVILTWVSTKKALWSVSIMERQAYSAFHGPVYPARVCIALGSLMLFFQGVMEFIRNILIITGHGIEDKDK